MAGPTIDDDFWFALSKEMVEGMGKSVVEAAGKVQTFSIWAWGIYTAAAAAGFALAAKGLTVWQSVWISAPSVALVLVYWLSVWTQLPIRVGDFDPRSPDQIREAYSTGARKRSWRLVITSGVSLVAAALVGIGLTMAALAREAKEPELRAEVRKIDGRTYISILARTAPSSRGTYRVLWIGKASAISSSAAEGSFLTDESGRVQLSVPVSSAADGGFEIAMDWIEDAGLGHRLLRRIGTPPTLASAADSGKAAPP